MTITDPSTHEAARTLLAAADVSDAPDPYVPTCPSWCTEGVHQYTWHPDDRVHIADSAELPLELEEGRYLPGRPGRDASSLAPALEVNMHQHVRESEPHVELLAQTRNVIRLRLTITEVDELARHLAALVELARRG